MEKKERKNICLHDRAIEHEGHCIIQWKNPIKRDISFILCQSTSSQLKMNDKTYQLFPLHASVNIEAEDNQPISHGNYFDNTNNYK